MKRLFAIAALAAGAGLAVTIAVVARDVARQSRTDEAQPADVIVVLGAAEYRGSPSPVLKARLEHALDVRSRGLAPRMMTTGGDGGDGFSEGEVARDYLVVRGVPSEEILVEDRGGTTLESLIAVSEIMRRTGMESAILVSDGYHLYRAKKILEARGVKVFGSPRPAPERGALANAYHYVRQAGAYLMWRAGINI